MKHIPIIIYFHLSYGYIKCYVYACYNGTNTPLYITSVVPRLVSVANLKYFKYLCIQVNDSNLTNCTTVTVCIIASIAITADFLAVMATFPRDY